MTRILRAAALFIGLVAPALGSASSAARAAESGAFAFTIAGIRAGTLTMSFDEQGTDYTAKARIDTAGIVGMFADFFFDGSATGAIAGGGKVVPETYASTSKSPRALRHSKILWKGGVPVSVSVNPPRSTAPDPAAQGGTLDPVSAGLKLFRTGPADLLCNTTVDVFDGSRRSRLKLDTPKVVDKSLVCEGTFARIEGEAHSMAERREFPFKLVFSPASGDLYQLERIEAPTNFGRAVIARQ